MKKNWFFSILALIVLAGILLTYWIGGLITQAAVSDNISDQDTVDYVVILGCGLDGDKPNAMFQSRIDTAIAFMKKYPNSVAICTGGQGDDEPLPEADVIEKALQKAKIPPGRIKKETTSKNTYENFQNARKIIDKEETEEENLQVAIVTSEFHLYRAQKLAEKHGFYDTIKISAPTPVGMYYPHFFREIAAVVAAWYRY